MKKAIVAIVVIALIVVLAILFWPQTTASKMQSAINEIKANITPKWTASEQVSMDKAIQQGRDAAEEQRKLEEIREKNDNILQRMRDSLDSGTQE